MIIRAQKSVKHDGNESQPFHQIQSGISMSMLVHVMIDRSDRMWCFQRQEAEGEEGMTPPTGMTSLEETNSTKQYNKVNSDD